MVCATDMKSSVAVTGRFAGDLRCAVRVGARLPGARGLCLACARERSSD
jgi:hypothetical protein